MLISLFIAVLVIGLVLYLIQMLPMDAKFKQIALIVAVVIFIIYLLRFLPL
jgi:hypothetical protein